MTRLETLKKELKQITEMECLAFSIKENAMMYYEHEIECIEKWGCPNPNYSQKGKYETVD